MVKMHLKRVSAPRTWDVPRKKSVFITRPLPGGHSFMYSMSLNTILKELLNICNTTREVKYLVNSKEVNIDGVHVHDEKAQVGFMDVISFPKTNKHFRVVLSSRGKLAVIEISDKEAALKVVRVKSKTMLKGKKIQIGLSDGRTVFLGKHDAVPGDSILLGIPKQTIDGVLKFAQGSTVLFIAGSYAGRVGTVLSVKNDMVKFKDAEGEYETKAAYAFVVGEKGKIVVKLA